MSTNERQEALRDAARNVLEETQCGSVHSEWIEVRRTALDALEAALARADAVAPEGAVEALRIGDCLPLQVRVLYSSPKVTDLLIAGERVHVSTAAVIAELATRPSAAPAAETGADFVLVPREATEEMIAAWAAAPNNWRTAYAAMLAATPTQDAAHGGRHAD